jgi:POT family proton-dependent oligopeptide transporter
MSAARSDLPHERWLGHPRGLAILFSAELWERFSYYGMRALLVLYVMHGLGRSEPEAYAVLAVYGAVVYCFGVVGGWVAQRYLGELRAILIGGVLMATGHLVMALPFDAGLVWALALLCVGNGLFKPNVSSLVGALYEQGDPRRASGYYLFYMGINIGGMLAPILCAAVSDRFGWHWGFGLAGAGMLLGLLVVLRGRALLRPHSQDHAAALARPLARRTALAVAFAILTMIPACALLLWRDELGHLAIEFISLAVLVILVTMMVRAEPAVRARLLALLILMLFNTLFWAAFEQISSSFVVFTERHVDRRVLGIELPAASLVAVNSALVIVFAPIIAWLWTRLARWQLEPSTPLKFVLGLSLLALGFLLLALGIERSSAAEQVALVALLGCYLLMTIGELCLSPVGLTMVAELSPPGTTSLCMGAWFLTFANAHLLSGMVATSTTVADGGPDRYAVVFASVGLAVLIAALVLLMLRGWMVRLIDASAVPRSPP